MATLERLRTIADELFRRVTKDIVESGTHVAPVLISLRPDGETEIIGLDFQDDRGKFLAYRLACRELWNKGSLGVIAINDTWVSTSLILPPRVRPRDDPQRTEAITISLRTRGGVQEVWLIPYERRPQGIAWTEKKRVFLETAVYLLEGFREG